MLQGTLLKRKRALYLLVNSQISNLFQAISHVAGPSVQNHTRIHLKNCQRWGSYVTFCGHGWPDKQCQRSAILWRPLQPSHCRLLQSSLHNITYTARSSPHTFTLGASIMPCFACMNASPSKWLKRTAHNSTVWSRCTSSADNKSNCYQPLAEKHNSVDEPLPHICQSLRWTWVKTPENGLGAHHHNQLCNYAPPPDSCGHCCLRFCPPTTVETSVWLETLWAAI